MYVHNNELICKHMFVCTQIRQLLKRKPFGSRNKAEKISQQAKKPHNRRICLAGAVQ